MKNFLFFPLFFSLFLASCHLNRKKVRGNGTVKTESRQASSFKNISVGGNYNVLIRQDSANTVKIEADENLMEYIEVYNEGETLVIETRNGYNLKGSDGIKVYVSSPAYNKLSASGACDIISENKITGTSTLHVKLTGASNVDMDLNYPGVDANLSGAGSIKFRGQTKDLSVDGSGSVDVKCMELMAENVKVEISGAGNASVFASVKLDVRVSGAGDVKYKGNAAVTKSISGSGSVTKVD